MFPFIFACVLPALLLGGTQSTGEILRARPVYLNGSLIKGHVVDVYNWPYNNLMTNDSVAVVAAVAGTSAGVTKTDHKAMVSTVADFIPSQQQQSRRTYYFVLLLSLSLLYPT